MLRYLLVILLLHVYGDGFTVANVDSLNTPSESQNMRCGGSAWSEAILARS